jgi:carboxypeptidase C (cathepsin A)
MKSKKTVLLMSYLVFFSLTSHAAEESQPDAKKKAPEASVITTQHEIRIDGQLLKYTASAGTLLMTNEQDEPVALMGFTAYVQEGGDPSKRPLMFAYNGGPGSASIWLHMGILGPQRAVAVDKGFGENGPFQRVDNEHSIIDEVDLVMIDPVGTGFSKPVGKGEGKDFWGVDQDIRSVSAFIVKYVTENGRWASPKFVLGESYGGMRTGGVAYYLLKNHMMALNGVVLVSPFMEMATGFSGMGIDLPHTLFLPTFAATAWYHDALDEKPEDFLAFNAEVEAFALDEYAPALLKGNRLSSGDRQNILAKLAQYTGISEDYWDRANLRVNEGRFTQELLRQRGITAGRVDSRFSGEMVNGLAENAFYDPMTTAIGPPYLAAFMDYYYNDLNVKNASDYVVFGDVFGAWDWSHRQPDIQGFKVPFPNTSIDLAYTMKQNPNMKVLVQQGYFDLATPHLTTKYYLDHLDISPELRENITLDMYEAGHMMYIHEPSMAKYKQDLERFIKASY